MAVYLTKEKREEIYTEYGGSASNSGSTKSQIALLTYRIQELSAHLQNNRKDFSCERSLLSMVGQRKRLLKYLMKTDINEYRALIEKLGIRK